MRPTAVESLRAIQMALAEQIAPELSAVYALDIVQTLTMLLESLANEWDTAADDLRRDNEKLRGLLSSVPAGGNVLPAALVSEMEEARRVPVPGSVIVSELAAENQRLRGALERLLVALEAEEPRLNESALALRRDIYAHLREVAIRGWSFWDMASFREKMAEVRSAQVTSGAA